MQTISRPQRSSRWGGNSRKWRRARRGKAAEIAAQAQTTSTHAAGLVKRDVCNASGSWTALQTAHPPTPAATSGGASIASYVPRAYKPSFNG